MFDLIILQDASPRHSQIIIFNLIILFDASTRSSRINPSLALQPPYCLQIVFRLFERGVISIKNFYRPMHLTVETMYRRNANFIRTVSFNNVQNVFFLRYRHSPISPFCLHPVFNSCTWDFCVGLPSIFIVPMCR